MSALLIPISYDLTDRKLKLGRLLLPICGVVVLSNRKLLLPICDFVTDFAADLTDRKDVVVCVGLTDRKDVVVCVEHVLLFLLRLALLWW